MWREKENGTATVHIPAERLALRFVGGGFMANPCTPDINDGRNKEEGKINMVAACLPRSIVDDAALFFRLKCSR